VIREYSQQRRIAEHPDSSWVRHIGRRGMNKGKRKAAAVQAGRGKEHGGEAARDIYYARSQTTGKRKGPGAEVQERTDGKKDHTA